MGADETVGETTVTEGYAVTIPPPVREQLEVEPGDRVRWHLADDGDVSVEVVRERSGAFDDFEPVDMGETDVVDDVDTGFVDYPE